MTAVAGINSSEADQRNGKNEHLRSFRLDYPPRKTADIREERSKTSSARTEALGKKRLFSKPQDDRDGLYQRVIRIAHSWQNAARPVAAISTGLALKGEIVVFRFESSLKETEILGQVDLGKEEAADIDLWAGEEADTAVLSYCTSHSVYILAIPLSKSSASPEPMPVYTVPEPDAFKSSTRPRLRSLRFLSPRHIILLANRPQRAGADLIILNLDRIGRQGSLTAKRRLNKTTKAAMGLEVCFLGSSPATGEFQIVIAVATQDSSIELLTVDYSSKNGLGKLKPYTILRDVHPASITKLAFSTPRSRSEALSPVLPVRSLKLASASVGQTVVVHTLTLREHPDAAAAAASSSSSLTSSFSPSPLSPKPSSPHPSNQLNTRYVLVRPGPSEAVKNTFSVFMAIVVIGFLAFLLQAFAEMRLGGTSGGRGAHSWFNKELTKYINIKSPAIITFESSILSESHFPTAAAADTATTTTSLAMSIAPSEAAEATSRHETSSR